MTLRDCKLGNDVILQTVGGTPDCRRRLLEWGFLRGVRIRPIALGPAGGVIVALGDARVAIDARTAGTLIVEHPQ
ncbi:MAG: ferrous iron transport protein A [Dactylosporangium sp.]|nr:ferrous iron transport protein A [Dactylosporangium sp.]NNJ62520.1 ferrous iron transport protein A [Dactylosporangium sp.]